MMIEPLKRAKDNIYDRFNYYKHPNLTMGLPGLRIITSYGSFSSTYRELYLQGLVAKLEVKNKESILTDIIGSV